MDNKILSKEVKLSFHAKTTINLDNEIEVVFTPTPYKNGIYKFVAETVKGDAEIQKILYIFNDNNRLGMKYDSFTKSFTCGNYNNAGFEIQYSVPIEYNTVDYVEVVHHFKFSANLIKVLNLYECYEKEIVLPGYEQMSFKYCIKKHKEGHTKLCIKNYDGCFIACFIECKKASGNPTKINIDAKIIKAALKFLYGKTDAIIGKETDVFKFGVKYGIQELIDACCSHFKESANPSNVCEYIQIAYSNNFKELKQKCKQIMTEIKSEIDVTKIADLSKDFLLDVYCR